MAGFTKFDPDAFLATAAGLQPSTLASLAALAGADRQNANPRPTQQKPIPTIQNQNWTGTAAKPAKVAKVSSHPEVIVPAPWFDRLASRGPQERPFLSPDPARRGRIVGRDGLLLRFCEVCGAGASFGYGVDYRAGKPGKWYCGAHRLLGPG